MPFGAVIFDIEKAIYERSNSFVRTYCFFGNLFPNAIFKLPNTILYFFNGKLRLLKGPTIYARELESAISKTEFEVVIIEFLVLFLSFLAVLKLFVNKPFLSISNSFSKLATLKT
jgi:hypothetical protein